MAFVDVAARYDRRAIMAEAHRAYGIMRGRGWTFADAMRFAWGRAREARDLQRRELMAFERLRWAA